MCLIICRVTLFATSHVGKSTESDIYNTMTNDLTDQDSLQNIVGEPDYGLSNETVYWSKTDAMTEMTTQILQSSANANSKESESNTVDQKKSDLEQITTSEFTTRSNVSAISEKNDSTASEQNVTKTEIGTISKGVYDTVKKVIWFGIVPPVALLGICGNVIGLWFILIGKQRQPFHLFLFALMGVDLVYLIIALLLNALVILEVYDAVLAKHIKCHVSANLHAIQSLTYGTCAHLITAMSLERLVNVMLPLKVKSFCLHKHTVVVILVLFVLNIAVGVPGFLILEPKYVKDLATNVTSCRSVPTTWANNPFSKVYVVLVLSIARLVPGVITFLSSILIAIFLARRRAHRVATFANKATKAENYEQFKITMTLMILSVSLLLSLIPLAITTIWLKYYPDVYGKAGPEYYTYWFFIDLGYFLRVFSSANDFFIYVLMSKASRTTLKSMVQSRCCFCTIKISVLGTRNTSNDQVS